MLFCRYDGGCEQITNIDFSKRVIASMMKQNLRQRPKMKWKVGDMTDMKVQHTIMHAAPKLSHASLHNIALSHADIQLQRLTDSTSQFSDGSFHVVLDKGGLDALMGEDSTEGQEAGRKLLAESSRVLKAGGCYLCITLAQTHVLSEPQLPPITTCPVFSRAIFPHARH